MNALTFEAEPFELSPQSSSKEPCDCPKCRAARESSEVETLEDELNLEQGVPPGGGFFQREFAGEIEAEDFEFSEELRKLALGKRPIQKPTRKTASTRPVARQVARTSVSGFPRYHDDVASLPPAERQRIERAAQWIVESHIRGPHPITAIRIIGHSDFDTPRRPSFEVRVSARRALSVMVALRAALTRHGLPVPGRGAPLPARIRWQQLPLGAAVPAVKQPRTEAERLRNRRVEILLEAERPAAASRNLKLVAAFPLRQNVGPQITQPAPTCSNPVPNQSARITRGGSTFEVNISALGFNPSTVGFIQQVVAAGTTKVTALRFSCHRVLAQAGGCLDVIPAWRFGADFNATLPATESFGDWEIGFIQTLASSSIRHVYTRGTNRCTTTKPLRDASAGSPSPWYDARFVHRLDAGKNPIIEDSPHTQALLQTPKLGDLRQVCLEGVFQIWLAVRKAKPAGAPILLAFKEIQVQRNWTLISGRSPEDVGAWVHRGGQREVRRGNGNDPKLPPPLVDGPTANDQQAACFREEPGATALCPETVPEFSNHCLVGVTCSAKP